MNVETTNISDWFDAGDGSTGDNRHPEAYDSYQVKCYNNESDVVYANGIDVEQKFIKNIVGMEEGAFLGLPDLEWLEVEACNPNSLQNNFQVQEGRK